MDNALAVRAKLCNWSDLDPPQEITNKVRGAMVGTLNHKCGGDAHRRLILSWIFSPFEGLEPISSKELTDNQIGALVRWIEWYKEPDTKEWLTGADFNHEILVVLTATMLAYSKSNLAMKDEYDIDPASPVLLAVELGGEIVSIDDGDNEPQSGFSRRHRPKQKDYNEVLEDF